LLKVKPSAKPTRLYLDFFIFHFARGYTRFCQGQFILR
jgi:hypothetical protein